MKTKFLYIIALLFLSVSVTAQVDRSVQPKPGPAPKINLGKPQTFELKNGLKVLVVENHKLPRVSATLTLDNGPILEGKKTGVSSLAGSLLGTGTATVNKDDFNEEVDYLGANIYFGSQSVSASSLSKYFPRILELMADAAQNPIFVQEEFDKEVNILQDGIKSGENSVENIASRIQSLLAYGKNHPYGEYVSKETIENITLTDVQSFYQSYFKPNNAYLIIVGDVNFKEIKKLVNKNFKNWEKGELPSYTIPEVTNVATTEIDFVDMPNSVQSDVAILSTVNLKMNNSDFFALKLANFILGGGADGRLTKNLREDKGYTYGSNSRISSNEKTATVFKAYAQVRNIVTDSSAIEIMHEITKIRDAKVTDEELSIAKAAYTGSFVRNVEKPTTVAQYALNIEINNLPKDFYETYLTKINSVTIDDIQRVSQKYFSADNARIVIVGKAVDVVPNLEKLPYPINYYDKEGNKTEKPELTKPIPEGVTKETVINNYFNAIGGIDKVKAVETTASVAGATIQGMELTMSIKSAVPNKQAVTVSGMGMVLSKSIFNGENGYNEQQGQKKELTEKEIAEKKSEIVPFPEIGYLTDDSISLEKIEPINGSDAYVVKKGENSLIYYDVKSGLKVKQVVSMEQAGQKMTQTFDYLDYKEVEGIKFPHLMKMAVGPQIMDFVIQEIKINKEVSESDFQ